MGLFSEYRQVTNLLKEKQQIVFYAESRYYYQYFEKLIEDLLQHNDLQICYITSDKKDPLLQHVPGRMKVIYCKWLLGFLFKQIRADVMIMTMPDLGNYFLKRSDGVKEYVYVFHAAVSTHLQYSKHAFENYDTIFCTGEYQVNEIRKAEELYKTPSKKLVTYGYPLIAKLKKVVSLKQNEKPLLLLAPSWFSGCIFETCFEDLLAALSGLDFTILIRSHPEYEKRYPARFKRIQKMIAGRPDLQLDNRADVFESLAAADILITDRSGIAFEFAFGTGRPVLFIDTALKQTNPDWRELNIEPVEIQLRSIMGLSVSPSRLHELAEKIREIKIITTGFQTTIAKTEESLFYNKENDFQNGSSHILECVRKN